MKSIIKNGEHEIKMGDWDLHGSYEGNKTLLRVNFHEFIDDSLDVYLTKGEVLILASALVKKLDQLEELNKVGNNKRRELEWRKWN